ncbi:unnamed protein product [Amoebophrya sp. A120]|nr:unnamed protein product [Amoebophrya sp. A120]|eukprot:GSA120T00015899001.1
MSSQADQLAELLRDSVPNSLRNSLEDATNLFPEGGMGVSGVMLKNTFSSGSDNGDMSMSVEGEEKEFEASPNGKVVVSSSTGSFKSDQLFQQQRINNAVQEAMMASSKKTSSSAAGCKSTAVDAATVSGKQAEQSADQKSSQSAVVAAAQAQQLLLQQDALWKQCEFSFQNKFEALLTETVANFKQQAVRDYGTAEKTLNHAFQARLDDTKTKYEDQLAEKRMQIDILEKAQTELVHELEEKKKFKNKLILFANKRIKNKEKLSLLSKIFGGWKVFKKINQDGKIKNGFAMKLREKRLMVLAWRRWWYTKETNKNELKKQELEQKHYTEKQQLIQESNLKEDNLTTDLAKLQADLDVETQTKQNLQANLKRVFMRGVCQLNFEAMNLLNTNPGGDLTALGGLGMEGLLDQQGGGAAAPAAQQGQNPASTSVDHSALPFQMPDMSKELQALLASSSSAVQEQLALGNMSVGGTMQNAANMKTAAASPSVLGGNHMQQQLQQQQQQPLLSSMSPQLSVVNQTHLQTTPNGAGTTHQPLAGAQQLYNQQGGAAPSSRLVTREDILTSVPRPLAATTTAASSSTSQNTTFVKSPGLKDHFAAPEDTMRSSNENVRTTVPDPTPFRSTTGYNPRVVGASRSGSGITSSNISSSSSATKASKWQSAVNTNGGR